MKNVATLNFRDMSTQSNATKSQAKEKLAAMKRRGEALLNEPRLNDTIFQTWSDSCVQIIQEAFGEFTDHTQHFSEFDFDVNARRRPKAKLKERIAVLSELISQIESAAGPNSQYDHGNFWLLLHKRVVEVAKPRFEAGHYADAVEAALKELNIAVKNRVKQKTNQELDGAPLMQKAFSLNAPIIVLDDLGTDSGRNQQLGYMQIFAGAMIGIRNPKAHENMVITSERAIHHLFLASLLFSRFEEGR